MQALPAEVFLPKSEQVQVQVEVDVLTEGVGYRCLWLGVLQAQRSNISSVLASTQLARCLGREVSGLDVPSVDPWVLHL